ncbi:gag-pol polyprotein [Tanacetum coccineum]
MSDMAACLDDLSYITLNNEKNELTQGDISETSNEPTQAQRNEFEELYASANEEMYPGCNSMTPLDFMEKFTHLKVNGTWTDSSFNDLLEFPQEAFPTSRWKEKSTTGKKVSNKSIENSKMQHPVDGKAWKNFDNRYLGYAAEKRNVRLGLVADGFNPFENLSQSYNMWSIILTTYNLPPCSLSGWSRQGYMACPTCNKDTPSERVLSKTAYVGHKRFLKKNHKWRRLLAFKGKPEGRDPPRKFKREDILTQLGRLPTCEKGKHPS